MKASLVLISALFIATAFAGNKVEKKVVAEFPCSLQKQGQIDVRSGVGKVFAAFDKDGDGLLTTYCRTTSTSLDTDNDGVTDSIITDTRYQFENCSKVEETEKNKQGTIVRHQYVYTKKLESSYELGLSCESQAQNQKNLVEAKLQIASSNPDSVEAEILNTLGNSNRVVLDIK